MRILTPFDRLKLARDDFDQQEKIYNTLVLGMRFYVGVTTLLGGWSLSLFGIGNSELRWDATLLVSSSILFWAMLLAAIWHLFQFIRGEHWTIPRTFDHYLQWEKDRLKQLESGDFDLGDKTAEQFAEKEMVNQMIGAYSDSACINRAGNLSRQVRITKVGRILLLAILALGFQGLAHIIHQHGDQSEQSTAKTATTTRAASSPG